MVCEQPKKIKLLICIKQQLLQNENKQGFSSTEIQLTFLFGKGNVFETRHGSRSHLIWFFLMHRFQVNSVAHLPALNATQSCSLYVLTGLSITFKFHQNPLCFLTPSLN